MAQAKTFRTPRAVWEANADSLGNAIDNSAIPTIQVGLPGGSGTNPTTPQTGDAFTERIAGSSTAGISREISAKPLKHLVIQPVTVVPPNNSATVFLLHGSGGSGENWVMHVAHLQKDPALHHVKWILPSAPLRRFSGPIIPCWFEVTNFEDLNANPDNEGIAESFQSITQLIEAEIASGTSPSRIIVGGFSQGATMSLLIGLTYHRKLAGLVVLAGRLPIQDQVREKLSCHATSVPIFWGHGDTDPLVKIHYAKQAIDFLRSIGFAVTSGRKETTGVTFNIYKDVLHFLVPEQLDDVRMWMALIIPAIQAFTHSSIIQKVVHSCISS